ncbi:diguanylate cyclase [compost metagenome]
MIIILLILVSILLLVLAVLYYIQNNNLAYYKTISKNLSAMSVIQNMFEILGSGIPATKKVEELNSTIVDAYSPKYSTISIFDGNSYEIKATNVEPVYLSSITSISDENDFKTNAIKNVSKYLTTSVDKTLTYKSAIERGIRSCLFSPIYHNGVYLGFWILEDTAEDAFDHISKDELAKLKNNMGVFIENIQNQEIIETAENADKQTGFYNNLYLYSIARQKISEYDNSSLIMFCLSNLNDINDKYGRTVGNTVLIKTINVIKELVVKDSIHIRYSGKRLLIICPNTDSEALHGMVERLLSGIKNEAVYINEEAIVMDTQIVMHTFKKQNNIEKELQKMVSYLDNMKDVNTIKII